MHPDWLRPDWQIAGVGALMTTRRGGVSAAPFDSMNLRDGPGDDPRSVQRNRELLQGAIGAPAVYLNQVHGVQVVRLGATDALPGAPLHRADASVTTEPGIACAVQVADCLPVLFAAPGGVAAAHAGWRGLSSGVLEATVASLCDAAACRPADVHAWLGACIGPNKFEVGADVLAAFGESADAPSLFRFKPGRSEAKWLANLALLARDRLVAAGVGAINGGGWCTVEDASRFFSYRRDGVTGRMVAAVWLT